jgi:hypothetical protein
MKKSKLIVALAGVTVTLPLMAAEVTYRNDIAPLVQKQCAECHSAKADAPTLAEFKLDEKKYVDLKVGPRSDTYENLLMLIGYPDTGALMRRLDDGSNTPDKKPGNMYTKLGENDAERAKNLTIFKAWIGEGGWNLNRWSKKGEVAGVTKEQLDKLKLKY